MLPKKMTLLCLLTFLCFLPSSDLFAQTSGLTSVRGSYWATDGTNLVEEKHPPIPILEREELFRLLKQNKRVVFLDIREPHEFEKSHIPNAQNVSFINRDDFFSQFTPDKQTTYIPYCNWDFRGYIAARELKEKGAQNVMMMYPHGLRGWIGSGLPAAGEEPGLDDRGAVAKLHTLILSVTPSPSSVILRPEGPKDLRDSSGQTKHITMRLLPKSIEPTHIEGSVGDRLVIDLTAEEEDHWFVMPDFDIDLHLKHGEHKTIELDLKKPGYFPFGCITCCVKYQCKIKQAILVDLKDPLSSYGE